MRIKDIKEIFDVFYIRFIIIITSLNMFEREKINHLKKLIVNRLKYHIFDYSIFILYHELVIRLRQINLNIKFIDK